MKGKILLTMLVVTVGTAARISITTTALNDTIVLVFEVIRAALIAYNNPHTPQNL